MKTIILKIETKSIKKTLQMIVPIMGHEVYILETPPCGFTLGKWIRWLGNVCFWKHLKKKGGK